MYFKWISSKEPQDRIEFKMVKGKIRKMISEKKNNTWKKACPSLETYLGGK